MIRVVMLGRTGNNLFQYALGRVLAKRHGVPLMLDASWFNREGWRTVSCLSRLPLRMTLRRRLPLASRALRRLVDRHPWEYLGVPVLKERDGFQGFDKRFLEAPSSCVLMGYFQSPQYFESIADELREDLDLGRLVWSEATRMLARRLEGKATVAVHVRRTDFVGNPVLEVCDSTYYHRAMNRMRERFEGVRFFVFSDDPGWCRTNLGGADVETVDVAGTGHDPLHALHLMSRANHHIIPNSSFSWWGAWLGRKPGQLVICPDRWFGGSAPVPTGDKCLPGWEAMGS